MACSSEGGDSLAVAKTADDKAALDDFSASTGFYFWLGLKKKPSSAGATCSGSGCDGLLEWEDGNNFKSDALAHPLVTASDASSDSNCFVVDGAGLGDRSCLEYNRFLCQFTCTGMYVHSVSHIS